MFQVICWDRGYLSGFYVPQPGTLVNLYGAIAIGLLISAGLLALLTPNVKKLMGTGRLRSSPN